MSKQSVRSIEISRVAGTILVVYADGTPIIFSLLPSETDQDVVDDFSGDDDPRHYASTGTYAFYKEEATDWITIYEGDKA